MDECWRCADEGTDVLTVGNKDDNVVNTGDQNSTAKENENLTDWSFELANNEKKLSEMKIPSYITAIIAGAVVTPIYIFTRDLLEKHIDTLFNNKDIDTLLYKDLVLIAWLIIGFLLPCLVATFDFRYFKSNYGSYRIMFFPVSYWTKEDFRIVYISFWKRILVVFVSGIISIILLSKLGIL